MNDARAEEEVVDIVVPVDDDEDALDVVAAGDEPSRRSGDRPKRRPKSKKKGKNYRKPVWMKDDYERTGSWFLMPETITMAILVLLGIVFLFLAGMFSGGARMLYLYGIFMQLIGIVWGIILAGNDGEGAKAFFWIYRWVYCGGNIERGLFPPGHRGVRHRAHARRPDDVRARPRW
jgi:hypothetical protein